MNLECELIINSDAEHLQQIYAGFAMLHRKGFLNLKQTISDEFLPKNSEPNIRGDYKLFNTKVILDDKIAVCYDTHDWNWIDEEILRDVDFYFKRSFDDDYLLSVEEKSKVFPLGLNYAVSDSQRDHFKVERNIFHTGKDRAKAIIKGLNFGFSKNLHTEQLDNLEALPDLLAEPKVIFMARAWDTAVIEAADKKREVENINEMRAQCVRALRKEFGGRFYGGLEHNDYARTHFADCLLPDASRSNKRTYLQTLKQFPICVTTVGLNGSNGWKLGEYVALSKAIVTEPLKFSVPGNFKAETNYLEFTNSDELVNSTVKLFENKSLRRELMMNNYRYYFTYLRPDKLILNTLNTVFNNSEF